MYQVHLAFGNACNLNCDYCFVNKSHVSLPTYEQCKNTIDEIVKKIGIDHIHQFYLFCTSEPFINQDLFWKCYHYIESLGIQPYNITIITNGSLLDIDNHLQDFKNRGYILISLDGPKDVHLASRKGSMDYWDSLESNIRKLRDNNIKVTASMVVRPDSSDIFDNCIKVFDMGIDKILMNLERKLNFTDEELNIIKNKYETFYSKLYNTIKSTKNFELIYKFQLGNDLLNILWKDNFKQNYGCHKYQSYIMPVIDIDGNIFECDYDVGNKSRSIGNIFTDDKFDPPRKNPDYIVAANCELCKWKNICPTLNYMCEKRDPKAECIVNKTKYEWIDKIHEILIQEFGKGNFSALYNTEMIYQLELSYRGDKKDYNKYIKYFPNYSNLIEEQAKIKR